MYRYIAFWAGFHLLQDQAYFWQTDLFWHENIVVLLSLLIGPSFSRNNICKKSRFVEQKRFLYHSYNDALSFTVASLALKWIRRWTGLIRVCFVVTLVPYEVGQFFLFPSLFLILSKTKTSYVVSVNIGQKVTRGGLETSELHCTKNAFCWVPLSNIIFKLQVSAGPSHVAIFYEMKGNWQDGK